jgi:hypothetical protein
MVADNQPQRSSAQADRPKPARDVPAHDVPARDAPARDGLDRSAGRKPTGPVIYTIQKGADVWPGRK